MSAIDILEQSYQEMLSDCDGRESQGWYGWIGLETVKDLMSDYRILQDEYKLLKAQNEILKVMIP